MGEKEILNSHGRQKSISGEFKTQMQSLKPAKENIAENLYDLKKSSKGSINHKGKDC